jgi:DNA-binding transcriptional LysR family regulator
MEPTAADGAGQPHRHETDDTSFPFIFQRLRDLTPINPEGRTDLTNMRVNGELTLKRLFALAALDECGTYDDAATMLDQSSQNVREHIRKLTELLGVPVVEDRGKGQYVVSDDPVVLELRDRGRLMIHQYAAMSRLVQAPRVKIRYLPQHCFFMAPVEAMFEHTATEIRAVPLGEEDRDVDRFNTRVLIPITAGQTDLAIGMPPDPDSVMAQKLTTTYLYSSRQEAMIPATDLRKQVSLRELVTEGRMLVPPQATRSRRTLENAIRADMPDAPRHPGHRVKREAFGTKVLIQYAMAGLGTVVVPSDIATVFHHGQDYGGPRTADFKWVPVCRSSGEFIYQEVYATYRRNNATVLKEAIDLICRRILHEVGTLRLEKAPVRPASPADAR